MNVRDTFREVMAETLSLERTPEFDSVAEMIMLNLFKRGVVMIPLDQVTLTVPAVKPAPAAAPAEADPPKNV